MTWSTWGKLRSCCKLEWFTFKTFWPLEGIFFKDQIYSIQKMVFKDDQDQSLCTMTWWYFVKEPQKWLRPIFLLLTIPFSFPFDISRRKKSQGEWRDKDETDSACIIPHLLRKSTRERNLFCTQLLQEFKKFSHYIWESSPWIIWEVIKFLPLCDFPPVCWLPSNSSWESRRHSEGVTILLTHLTWKRIKGDSKKGSVLPGKSHLPWLWTAWRSMNSAS